MDFGCKISECTPGMGDFKFYDSEKPASRSCGCKGLIVDGKHYCIDSCDGEGDVGFYEREQTSYLSETLSRSERDSGKYSDEELRSSVPRPYEPLPQEEVSKYVEQIGRLICDGHSFRDVQRLLSHEWKNK